MKRSGHSTVKPMPFARNRLSARAMAKLLGLTGIAMLSGMLPSCRARAAPTLLHRVMDVPLPGRAVRFDYQNLDSGSNRLYISHMNDGHVVVFDVERRHVLANIAGVPGATGVLIVPELHRLYASASASGQVAVIDPAKLQVIARIPAGQFPDGIAFDPLTKRLFVSDETGGADVVIDTRTNRRLTTIKLGGGVGNTQYDTGTHTIFVTVGDTNELIAIDPQRLRVQRRLHLSGGHHPHGLLIDSAHRLAFVACQGNSRLLVVDLRSLKVIGSYSVGEDSDVLAYDPGLRRLYVACESGTISIFDEKEGTLEKRGDVHVAAKAHTVAVDPRTHLLYLPLENMNGKPVLRIMSP
jgi:YVTN family beta-propeller protein